MEISTKQLTYNHLLYKNPYSLPETFMMHAHNTYELIFFERGNATYTIENRIYQLKKNDLVFIRPLKYHYVETKAKMEYCRYNIAFDSSIISKELIHLLPPEMEVLNCPKDSIIAQIFDRMEYYSQHLDEAAFKDLLPSLLKELIYAMSLASDNLLTTPSGLSPLLTNALDYINENLFTIDRIKDVCDKFFITEQYLFRLFQTQLKITPKKYINTKRLLHAQKMIQRGKKPVDVYLQCGFETYVGFYKQYVKIFGYPPSKEKNITTV